MDYKYCPECGQKLEKDDIFCPNCGTKQPDMVTNYKVEKGHDKNSFVENNQAAAKLTEIKERDETNQNNKKERENELQPNYLESVQTKSKINNRQEYHQQPVSMLDAARYQSRNNEWHPYNESVKPGISQSFNLWLKAFDRVNNCMGRADFWWGYFAIFLINFLIILCTGLIVLLIGNDTGIIVGYTIYFLNSLIVSIWVAISSMERLHDTGHSGWNYWWILTGIGGIYVIYLLCQPTNWNEKRWVRING